jgi:hypothetical protein
MFDRRNPPFLPRFFAPSFSLYNPTSRTTWLKRLVQLVQRRLFKIQRRSLTRAQRLGNVVMALIQKIPPEKRLGINTTLMVNLEKRSHILSL